MVVLLCGLSDSSGLACWSIFLVGMIIVVFVFVVFVWVFFVLVFFLFWCGWVCLFGVCFVLFVVIWLVLLLWAWFVVGILYCGFWDLLCVEATSAGAFFFFILFVCFGVMIGLLSSVIFYRCCFGVFFNDVLREGWCI